MLRRKRTKGRKRWLANSTARGVEAEPQGRPRPYEAAGGSTGEGRRKHFGADSSSTNAAVAVNWRGRRSPSDTAAFESRMPSTSRVVTRSARPRADGAEGRPHRHMARHPPRASFPAWRTTRQQGRHRRLHQGAFARHRRAASPSMVKPGSIDTDMIDGTAPRRRRNAPSTR